MPFALSFTETIENSSFVSMLSVILASFIFWLKRASFALTKKFKITFYNYV